MNYYKRHLGDYAKDTRTISTYEHGVYTLLLDTYYSEERPFSTDQAYDICRTSNAKERVSVQKILLKYFKGNDSAWTHSYADRVIAEAREKSEKAKESAEHRWAEAMRTQCERNANAQKMECERNASHKPLATSHKPDKEKTARKRALPPDFGISESVRSWALENGFSQLEKRLEHFIGYVTANGKSYADWDAAFRNAIRDDWAKLKGYRPPVMDDGVPTLSAAEVCPWAE